MSQKQIGRFTVNGSDGRIVSYDAEIDLDGLNLLGLKASRNKSRKSSDGPVTVKVVGYTPPRRDPDHPDTPSLQDQGIYPPDYSS